MRQKQLLTVISAGLISLGMAGSAHATLIGRLAATPGGTDYQAYYDDVADLTWLADANHAKTSGYDTFGLMNWQAANAWAAQLTVGSVGGWRLANSETCTGFNCTGSEMGNLFYSALVNTAGSLTNTGPFSNIQSFFYWSATAPPAPGITGGAYVFGMGNGFQDFTGKNNRYYAWAVQSGDVSAVPVPAAVWLFGSGLLGLIGVTSRKGANH